MPEYAKLIQEMEGELNLIYEPGAIAYIDEHFDNAWSNAIDRFDIALSRAIESHHFAAAEHEAQVYRASILDLMKRYKKRNNSSQVEDFLNALAQLK